MEEKLTSEWTDIMEEKEVSYEKPIKILEELSKLEQDAISKLSFINNRC